MKTRARYINIINSHLAASDAGRWHYAMYVMIGGSLLRVILAFAIVLTGLSR